MKPSSTTPSPPERAGGSAERGAAGRGGRLLTEWVLECLQVYGARVERAPDESWRVELGSELGGWLGRERLEFAPAREGGDGHDGREPLAWESPAVQELLARVRDRGLTADLWLPGAAPEEGLRVIAARLEVDGQKPALSVLRTEVRPQLVYNFKVRWQGSEGREELRSLRFDPASGQAREVPPADQYGFAPPPGGRPPGRRGLPVQAGFEAARGELVTALREKLDQRLRRARASTRDEEIRLNAYYSQLLREERGGSPRRGEKRSRERVEQLKREWRHKLEALGGGGEQVRYALVSASVLWTPWLVAEVRVPGPPRLARATEMDLHLRRWEGLTCDACGRPHTWVRQAGTLLLGRECAAPPEGADGAPEAAPARRAPRPARPAGRKSGGGRAGGSAGPRGRPRGAGGIDKRRRGA